MEGKDFMPFDRPIVLLPPPESFDKALAFDPSFDSQTRGSQNANHSFENRKNFDFNAFDHNQRLYQRQQSVGYNLQQEFETLKADLDLDLSNLNESAKEPQIAAPTLVSPYSMAPSLSENFARDRMSPGLPMMPKSLGFLPEKFDKFDKLDKFPSRPQLVNDFSLLGARLLRQNNVSNFYPEMLAYTSWMETLEPQDMYAMLDHWCTHLPFDVLLSIKSKLETHLHRTPVFSYDYGVDLLLLDESLRLQLLPAGLAQPKPKSNFRNHLFADMKVQRPKLAEPTHLSMHLRFPTLDRARLPTLHLYEKTNFLQLAAGSLYSGNDDLDLSATLKLGALATINSRVALDSRKTPRVHSGLYEESINRAGNSSSVPATTQKYLMAAMAGPKKKEESPKGLPTSSSGASLMPSEITSPELLRNIPAWLKLLRLHKYTDCLKDVYWKDLIELSDQQLEDKGVKALGARRKLLKAFEAVKQA